MARMLVSVSITMRTRLFCLLKEISEYTFSLSGNPNLLLRNVYEKYPLHINIFCVQNQSCTLEQG